jgi:hypothetical protein
MATVRRAVGLAVFGLFALTLVVRPVTRYLPTGFAGGSFDASALLFTVPGVVVVLAMLGAGLRKADTDSDTFLGAILTTNGATSTELGGQSPDDENRNGEPTVDRGDGWSGDRFLTGQGGTRNKGFEIEEQPPETDVDEHVRYLRDQLDDEDADGVFDDTAPNDSVESDYSTPTGEFEIPTECPEPYCDADWQSSGLLGGATSYERLPDGEQVRCEKCGGITTLE